MDRHVKSDVDLYKIVRDACDEDHESVWGVLWMVKHLLGIEGAQEARIITLDLLKKLLASGEVKAGFPTGEGDFVVVHESIDEIMARIGREWDGLGREPNCGEIIWFTTVDLMKRNREVQKGEDVEKRT
jgi:hypothetical protein